jgi:hypothetical protein
MASSSAPRKTAQALAAKKTVPAKTVASVKSTPSVKRAAPASTKSPAKSAPAPTSKVPAKKPVPAKSLALAKPAPFTVTLYQPDSAGAVTGRTKAERFQLTSSPVAYLLGFKHLHQAKGLAKPGVWGLLPHDFERRTGMGTEQFKAAIKANPGHDVYYCSAHPDLECLHVNPWYSAEVNHPGFVALCRRVFEAVGLPPAVLDAHCHSSLFATGQLMAATPAFWDAYLKYVDAFLHKAQQQLDPATKAALFNEKPQPGRLSKLFLLVARLLGLMLMGQVRSPTPWKAFKVELQPQGQPLNHALALLREMRDRASQQKDGWLADCWQQFRNLYLLEVMGKPWVQKHLPAITPSHRQLWPAVPQLVYPYTHTPAFTSVSA